MEAKLYRAHLGVQNWKVAAFSIIVTVSRDLNDICCKCVCVCGLAVRRKLQFSCFIVYTSGTRIVNARNGCGDRFVLQCCNLKVIWPMFKCNV